MRFPLYCITLFVLKCALILILKLVIFVQQGPFVQVEELMEQFRRCTLPESTSLTPDLAEMFSVDPDF